MTTTPLQTTTTADAGTTTLPSFEEFRTQALAQGSKEVLERRWEADTVVAEHSHPFTASALLVQGELWLTCPSGERHLRPGDRYEVEAKLPHAERYGPDGATIWVGRRY